jgi:hypothetical protein
MLRRIIPTAKRTVTRGSNKKKTIDKGDAIRERPRPLRVFSVLFSSVACRHLSGLFDPDGIRDTAPKHLTLFSSDMSVGLCHASVGQPICHQTSFTLADLICPSLDLIQRSMSDYVIHSTAGMIDEADSMLSRTRASLAPAQPVLCILDNIDPLAKLAAKR